MYMFDEVGRKITIFITHKIGDEEHASNSQNIVHKST